MSEAARGLQRQEILADALAEAEHFLSRDDPQEAFAAFAQGLKRYPETKNHPALELGFMHMMNGRLQGVGEMRTFLRGFK